MDIARRRTSRMHRARLRGRSDAPGRAAYTGTGRRALLSCAASQSRGRNEPADLRPGTLLQDLSATTLQRRFPIAYEATALGRSVQLYGGKREISKGFAALYQGLCTCSVFPRVLAVSAYAKHRTCRRAGWIPTRLQ